MQDFQKTENAIMKVLENSKDPEIYTTLEFMKKRDLSHMLKSATATHKKFRYVDPDVVINNQLVRLSAINADFKVEIECARKEIAKGVRSGKI